MAFGAPALTATVVALTVLAGQGGGATVPSSSTTATPAPGGLTGAGDVFPLAGIAIAVLIVLGMVALFTFRQGANSNH